MRILSKSDFLLALLLVSLPLAAAKRSAAEQEKIDWLLSEIERSDAAFLRNGAEYGGREAASHLKTKLFWAGKRVQTARDFILGVCSPFETIRTKQLRLMIAKARRAPSSVSAMFTGEVSQIPSAQRVRPGASATTANVARWRRLRPRRP